MTEPLPYGNFAWFNPPHITMDSTKGYDNEGEVCYILEIDLEYPIQLHTKHADCPLAPELTYVKANSLSPYQVELCKNLINYYLSMLIHQHINKLMNI